MDRQTYERELYVRQQEVFNTLNDITVSKREIALCNRELFFEVKQHIENSRNLQGPAKDLPLIPENWEVKQRLDATVLEMQQRIEKREKELNKAVDRVIALIQERSKERNDPHRAVSDVLCEVEQKSEKLALCRLTEFVDKRLTRDQREQIHITDEKLKREMVVRKNQRNLDYRRERSRDHDYDRGDCFGR